MTRSSILLTIVLWALFGLQHSILAQGFVKDFTGRLFGQNFVDYGYRFVYFASQCFVYPAFWYIVSHFESGSTLWVVPPVLYPVHFFLKIAGHFLIVATFIAADINTFVGTKQLWVYFRAKFTGKAVDRVAVFGHNNLVIGFPFTFVRHPMYLGIILSLLTATGIYTEKIVLNLILLLLYVEVGSYYEEKQLVRLFGDAYRTYQATTSKYVPISWLQGLWRPRVSGEGAAG
jgi:protein-S-isoprenylcysteine O-methyltransferase Ste14